VAAGKKLVVNLRSTVHGDGTDTGGMAILQESRENTADLEFSRQISGERGRVLVGWRRCFLSSLDLGQGLEEDT